MQERQRTLRKPLDAIERHAPLPDGQIDRLAPCPAARNLTISLARKTKFLQSFQADLGPSSPARKNISLPVTPKSVASLRYPASSKRGVRVVTNVEAGCGGRESGARRAQLMRTAKSSGPDAPMQASRS